MPQLICSKCGRIHLAQFTSLINTSLCCDAKIINKPNKFEDNRIKKAKKDLELFDKGFNIRSNEFPRVE